MIRLSWMAQRVNQEEPLEDLGAEARPYISRKASLPICRDDSATAFQSRCRKASERNQKRLFRSVGGETRDSRGGAHRPTSYKKARAAPGSKSQSGVAERVHT